MIWLVAAEAVAIGILTLIVVALAHSYAGLAARVEDTEPPSQRDVDEAPPTRRTVARPSASSVVAHDVAGVTIGGERVLLAMAGLAHDTLLAFLSSSCASCGGLWDGLGAARRSVLPADVRLVVVAKGEDRESPSQVAALAAGAHDVDVILSSEAWSDHEVPGSPYFVMVGRDGRVLGQGTARSWQQVTGLIDVASGDARHAATTTKSRRDRRQELDVDRVLLDAGLLPGDASLYPVRGDGGPHAVAGAQDAPASEHR